MLIEILQRFIDIGLGIIAISPVIVWLALIPIFIYANSRTRKARRRVFENGLEVDPAILLEGEEILLRINSAKIKTLQGIIVPLGYSVMKRPVLVTNKRVLYAFSDFGNLKYRPYGNFWYEKKPFDFIKQAAFITGVELSSDSQQVKIKYSLGIINGTSTIITEKAREVYEAISPLVVKE